MAGETVLNQQRCKLQNLQQQLLVAFVALQVTWQCPVVLGTGAISGTPTVAGSIEDVIEDVKDISPVVQLTLQATDTAAAVIVLLLAAVYIILSFALTDIKNIDQPKLRKNYLNIKCYELSKNILKLFLNICY